MRSRPPNRRCNFCLELLAKPSHASANYWHSSELPTLEPLYSATLCSGFYPIYLHNLYETSFEVSE